MRIKATAAPKGTAALNKLGSDTTEMSESAGVNDAVTASGVQAVGDVGDGADTTVGVEVEGDGPVTYRRTERNW